MSHPGSVKRGRRKDVPFGVRALEKGVQVEGVWDSRVNTPIPSLPGSPVLSATRTVPNHQKEASNASSSSTTTRMDIRPADHLTPSVADDQAHRGRPTYTPRRSSGLRFSNANADLEREDVLGHISTSANHSSSGPSPNSSPNDSPTSDILSHPVYQLPHNNFSYTSQESNPFLTPTPTNRKSNDEAIPLSHINNAVPLHDQLPSTSYSEPLDTADLTYEQDHAQPALSFEANKRSSQVIRKINSGFEILRPGTFGAPKQSTDSGTDRKEVRFEDKKSLRKLQKKAKRDNLI